MKHVFISQPMRGRSDEEILAERSAVMEKARELYGDAGEIKSFFADETPALEKLGRSIVMMSQADVCFFTLGWETARGCRIEHEAAAVYGLEVVEIGNVSVTQEQVDELFVKSKIEISVHMDKCLCVICQLPNGFVLTESSACVDSENFDEKIGYDICVERIKNRIWELEGYKLQCAMSGRGY